MREIDTNLHIKNDGWRFLAIFFGSVGIALLLLIAAGTNYANAVMEIPLNNNWSWYRDFAGRNFPEIQDQDIFYQNIGGSIAAAKKADIIILGTSFTSYAFDPEVLRQFSKTQGLKIYNMSFIGVCSGEFSRRVIKRWNIKPRLWIIDADDHPAPFFNKSTDMWIAALGKPIQTLNYGRLQGFLTVVARNLRWRIEDYLSPWTGQKELFPPIYRNIETGDVFLRFNPGYVAKENKKIMVARPQKSYTNAETVQNARDFIKDIGGQVVLTLVPHSQYYPPQARDMARALGVELIIPPNADYSTWDGGGHLDSNSAVAFTKYVMSELIRTKAFKDISRLHGH